MANLIGTGLNQVPTNGLLGNMAFQNKEAVSMDLLTVTSTGVFSVGGSQIYKDVDGNVGFGQSSPATFSSMVNLYASGTNGAALILGDPAKTTRAIVLGDHNNQRMDVGTATNHPLRFLTNNTERMRLDTSGNLGIGTSSPVSKLSLYNASGNIYTRVESGADNNVGLWMINNQRSWLWSIAGGAAGGVMLTDLTASATRMFINSSGNVGIGTESPTAKLDVYGGASGAVTNVAVGNAATAFVVGVDSSNNCQVRTAQNVSINFYTNAAERMRITGAGNLQLGTASLATTATDGFPYIPTCAGTPTGTPTAITGYAPMVVDSTNNKLYVYVGGAWQAMN